MKKIIMILFSFQVFILAQCIREKENKKYNLEDNLINLEANVCDTVIIDISGVTKYIDIIPLQKTKESLLGNIHSIVEGDGYILVCTVSDYFLFDYNGNYLDKPFITGRGPNEVLNPRFCTKIRDKKIWFYDKLTKRSYIRGYDVLTKNWESVYIHAKGDIISLVMDTDSTVTYIDREMHPYLGRISLKFSYVKQKMNGLILDSISFGENNYYNFLSMDLLESRDGGLMAMSPRGDSLTYINDHGATTIWRNKLDPIKIDNYRIQNITWASLLNYTSDTILLVKSNLKVKDNSSRVGQSDIILIDRVEGDVICVKIYIDSITTNIIDNPIFLLGENRFCLVLYPSDLIHESDNLSKVGHVVTDWEMTVDGNPILLFGEFR